MSSTSTSTSTSTDNQAKSRGNQSNGVSNAVSTTTIGNNDTSTAVASVEKTTDIDDSSARYAAYFNRIRTIMRASHRYLAYLSDVGESFRPVAHPGTIKAAYVISFGYVGLLVCYDTWKVYVQAKGQYRPGLMPWSELPPANEPAKEEFFKKNPKHWQNDWRVAFVKDGVFQLVALMALPAFTIHSTVRYSLYIFKHVKNQKIKTWGPVACGLAVVPALPYLFDEPVEHLLDRVFDKLEPYD